MAEYKSMIPEFKQKLESDAVKGLDEVGAMIASKASAGAPVDEGELRDSYSHMVDANEKKVDVGSDADHAPFVEKGTYKMSAQPHLSPAMESNRGLIEQLIKGAMGS